MLTGQSATAATRVLRIILLIIIFKSPISIKTRSDVFSLLKAACAASITLLKDGEKPFAIFQREECSFDFIGQEQDQVNFGRPVKILLRRMCKSLLPGLLDRVGVSGGSGKSPSQAAGLRLPNDGQSAAWDYQARGRTMAWPGVVGSRDPLGSANNHDGDGAGERLISKSVSQLPVAFAHR